VRQLRPQTMATLTPLKLHASDARTVEDLLATCNAQTTYGDLIKKIGAMEQARMLRFVDDEIARLNGVVDKHRWAAHAREPTKHQDKLLELAAEELQEGIANRLREMGAEVCQQVESLTQGALRYLPADYRSLPFQQALQLYPGVLCPSMPHMTVPPPSTNATVSANGPTVSDVSVANAGTSAVAMVQAFPTTAVVNPTLTAASDTADILRSLPMDDLLQGRLEAADKLKQDIETTTAQLELLSSEQRQSLICQFQSHCQSVFRPISVANTGGA